MAFPVAMTLLYKTNPSAKAKREDEERVDQRISVTAVELASIMSQIKGATYAIMLKEWRLTPPRPWAFARR